MAADRLDVRGTKCPLPVLRAKKALTTKESGAVLEILSDDPHAPDDLAVFCRQAGHRLVSHQALADGSVLTTIEKRVRT